ncbi:hypothetical protein Bbelb_223000 [Branchiostoma belcheri]|nr:hypothetical protein Bbelb_223000 [Branchiostoma belcheri]
MFSLNVTTPTSSLDVPLHQTGQYGIKETMKSAQARSTCTNSWRCLTFDTPRWPAANTPPPPGEPLECPGGSLLEPGPLVVTRLSGVKSTLVAAHPLEASETLVRKNQDQVDFTMLRNVQGMHAPLRLQMERHIASKVQRLPCLHSSNVALDTLRGMDEHIDFNDVLNDPTAPEVMGDPHIMTERRAGILQ